MRTLTLWICGWLLALGTGLAAAEAPVIFINEDRHVDALVEGPAWYGLMFPDDAVLQKELEVMWGVFLTRLGNSAFISSQKTKEKKWHVPMQVITSGDGSGRPWSSFVNATELGGGIPDGFGRSFNLVDLFGCVVDSRLYDLVNRLDFKGVLVLPFSGTDFAQVKRLPPGVRKLVVYNSTIDQEFNALVEKMDALEEVVFWGCGVRKREGIKPRFEHASVTGKRAFASTAAKVRRLTLMQCSADLTDAVGWQNLPRLEDLVTTQRGIFVRQVRLEILQISHPGTAIALPEYPKLKRVVYYRGLPQGGYADEQVSEHFQRGSG